MRAGPAASTLVQSETNKPMLPNGGTPEPRPSESHCWDNSLRSQKRLNSPFSIAVMRGLNQPTPSLQLPPPLDSGLFPVQGGDRQADEGNG